MQTTYFLRINTHNDSQILKVLDAPYIYVKETGHNNDNPHIHAIFKTGLKRCAINKRIASVDGYRPGNGFYSLKVLQPTLEDPLLLDPHAYLFKEGTPIHLGYSHADIQQYQQHQQQVSQQMARDLQAKKDKKTGLKTKFLEYITKDSQYEITEKGFKVPLDPSTGGIFLQEKVALLLCEYVRDNQIDFFESQLVRTLQNIMLQINPGYTYHLQGRLLDRS